MNALQTINQGTPPTGQDGDSNRVMSTKFNSNVEVLNTQAALTSATPITNAQALTAAHVGKRVNISLSVAGVVNMPVASTCAADQVTLLRNIGTTVVTLAVTSGSGDACALSKLNPGEAVLMDTDGVHAWTVLMRGRTNADNEVVNGNCTVNGNETIGGTLGVTGNTTLGGTLGVTGKATLGSAEVTGNAQVDGALSVTGAATFATRPTFAGNAPYDSGNLANPATTDTTQTISGAKLFSKPLVQTLTGGTAPTDKFVQLYTDGSKIAVGGGLGSSQPDLISADATAFAAGVPKALGRNMPVLWAFWTGGATAGAPTTFGIAGCTVANAGAGIVRVTFATPYQSVAHMIIVSGNGATNTVNWCVPQILAYAANGAYVDIACAPTGGAGGGNVVGATLQLLVLKVQ